VVTKKESKAEGYFETVYKVTVVVDLIS